MTRSLDFPAIVTHGRLPEEVARQIGAVLRQLDGKRVVVSVKEAKRSRSKNQNAYYWSCVIPPIVDMFRDAGNYADAEDVHEFLKSEVGKLKRVLVTPDGEVKTAPGSTAKLNTMEFEVYLETVRAWAAEYRIEIPLPNEALTT
ncbi:recombination protein NinB [Zavarzinella formosa]|uniref:recombination protein NinB n=1 Tax=Zavarzinella formosa TaxID=360055 RepID=UPI0002F67620|nr:recombination protein NinB [Zavarzinella formosa]